MHEELEDFLYEPELYLWRSWAIFNSGLTIYDPVVRQAVQRRTSQPRRPRPALPDWKAVLRERYPRGGAR